MTKVLSPTLLRANLYRLLDEVLETGVPIEIDRGGRRLRIVPVEPASRFSALSSGTPVTTADRHFPGGGGDSTSAIPVGTSWRYGAFPKDRDPGRRDRDGIVTGP